MRQLYCQYCDVIVEAPHGNCPNKPDAKVAPNATNSEQANRGQSSTTIGDQVGIHKRVGQDRSSIASNDGD